jgi:RHS repeat-associated protein
MQEQLRRERGRGRAAEASERQERRAGRGRLANSAGTKYLAYDLAGNVLLEASLASHLDLSPDAAGKLSRMTEETTHETSTLAYDGRGFLAKARNAVTDCGPVATTPTYGSEGLLYERQQQSLFTSAITAQTRVFYFAGRPVAQLDGIPATGTLTYLAVDHLGTPILASTGAAAARWSGGFEPFGRDFTNPSAQNSGIFLRLPGQWDDTIWDNTHLGSGLYYNLNRWYEPAVGRYSQVDPLAPVGEIPYLYARSSPLLYIDPLGLRYCVGAVSSSRTAGWRILRHHWRGWTHNEPPPRDTAGDFNLIRFRLTCPCPRAINRDTLSFTSTEGAPDPLFKYDWPLEPSALYVDVSVSSSWVYSHDFDRLARTLHLCYSCK